MVAKSNKRKKDVYVVPRNAGKESKNPKWFVPAMGSLYIIGLVWIVIYYVSRADYPLPIGNSNLLVGFGFLFSGFILSTRWK